MHGAPFLQYQPDVTHHRHLALLLRSVAAESAASGAQRPARGGHSGFLAEVRAMQLAGLSVHCGTQLISQSRPPGSDPS